MTHANVLMTLSWAENMRLSPHDPSGSWFCAIHSKQLGNLGRRRRPFPSSSATNATHAVSYAETLISPSPIDLSIDLTIAICRCTFCPYKNQTTYTY